MTSRSEISLYWQAVHEELAAVLGVELCERSDARRGERNGVRTRTLTGPAGPLELTLPRARLFTPTGEQEWASKLVPRYQRRIREVNESVLAAYLSGANTRRIAGALRPLLKGAPLSKSAVSRVVGTLRWPSNTPDSVLPFVRARYGRQTRASTPKSRQKAAKAPERWATGDWFPSEADLARMAPSRTLFTR
jgi:hypothetical protein